MDGIFGKLLKGFGIFLLCSIVTYAGIGFLLNRLQSSEKERDKLREQEAKISEEARKLDPEGKTVITDDLLNIEYKLYYSQEKAMRDMMSIFLYGAMGIVLLFSGISLVVSIVKRRISAPRIIGSVLPAVLIIVAVIFVGSRNIFKLPPKPEKTECKVETVKIAQKNTKVTTDTDGDGNRTETTTHYYIYFFNQDNKSKSFSVTKTVYEKINIQDTCYMAYVKDRGDVHYYKYFDPDKYRLP